MGKFLTAEARTRQINERKKWVTLDNLLYEYDDGVVELTPRLLETDNYTFPKILALITGDKSEYDVRPSHPHDLKCRYHKRIIVTLSSQELIDLGYLREHYDPVLHEVYFVCDDIPAEYLSIETVTKWDCDCQFKEMILATGNVKKWRAGMYRSGVFFNASWLWTGKELDLNKVYGGIL